MKKALIIFYFTSMSMMAFSQDYIPLIEDENSWNVLAAGIYPFWDTVYSTESYKISGDTILNSVSYKKMYTSLEEITYNWNFYCYMREDTTGKVWLKMTANDEEFLMYDFSIIAGDTVQVGKDDPVDLLVDSITTVTINGIDHQEYWFTCFNNEYYHEYWIEGIGSNQGIVWSGSAMIVGGFFRLLCESKNEVLYYMNPFYSSCYVNTVGIDENVSNSIEIYPVPAKDILFIDNVKKFELISIMIADLSGRIVKVFNKNLSCLDISSIPKGIYIFKVTYNGGEFVKKILID